MRRTMRMSFMIIRMSSQNLEKGKGDMAPRGGLVRRGSNSTSSSSRVGTSSDVGQETPADQDTSLLQEQEEELVPTDVPTTRWSFKLAANGRLAAHPKLSGAITKTFHRVRNDTGFSWKLTPQDVKDRYFEDFKNFFSWPSEWDAMVHEKWLARARIRFSDFIHDVKDLRGANDLGRPEYVTEEMWRGLCRYWDLPEVKARSEAARRCRLASTDGSGTIPGTHRGGSKAVEILAQEMSEEQGIPVQKCIYPAFQKIHKRKDGTYTTKKAEELDAKIQEIARAQGEGADLSKIFLEVQGNRLCKKQRMYGTGTLVTTLLSDTSSTSSFNSQFQPLQEYVTEISEVREELRKEREDRLRLEESFRETQLMVQQLMANQQSSTRNGDNGSSPAP